MPLEKCPFSACGNGIFRPMLEIRIINPTVRLSQKTYAIIDTGADECAVPAHFASILGHDLAAGTTKTVGTGNGESTAYGHTTTIEVYRPKTTKLLYTISNTPIDFMPNLHVVLLGVKQFLSNFILTVNYPSKEFSLKKLII